MVRPEGLEPSTSWSEAKRSIQLSYERIFVNALINDKTYLKYKPPHELPIIRWAY